ncbi:pentatricopeptide repeat-containing protein At3g49170, chloroplastic-like [Herrania umbratica]|uniref:Pentatricopeptide repeat-containing protein At3g49170, chloroplastic-like n=1 Tax=Herrania umbratica TaxID=108875 RepID=A0A6J1A251_9ROSI|nr:pentatricopeptide repeat-containing protein At3g49170, chloroplastic-like [Herrania umbratica]
MWKKNPISWNSLIGGYVRQGLGRRALEELDGMMNSGFRPNQVTFVNILYVCRDNGLVEEGERHFNSMGQKYKIQAGLEHYACMVEIYGKAGQLDKAEKLIKGMTFESDVIVWDAFSRAFCLHSGLELCEFATEGISKLKMNYPAAFSALIRSILKHGRGVVLTELRP